MDTQKYCQSCQAPLAADAPRGLCPACLMKVAMATGTAAGQEKPGFTPPSVEELAGKFPQFEILELIGRGGMGAVYKARQKELDRVVALKILPPGIGEDAAFAERFAREAKALARLNHPGIITIHDFGRADGLYFFVMEFVDGVNLRQLLASSRVSPREALAIVPQICDALQFAHDQGIVHRDIKPENILLDRRGRVKVADFGLAKIVAGGDASPRRPGEDERTAGPVVLTTLTDAGKVMGTPAYMAPEQREHPGEVDHRADIYALGVVFYQMLTGELPGQRIEPPSKKVQIDVRLDEVVLRALEKNPQLRYQQVSDVKTCVETIVGTPGVPPAEPSVATSLARKGLLSIFFVERAGQRHLNWPFLLLYCSTIGLWVNGIILATELAVWLLNVKLPHGKTLDTPGHILQMLLWMAAFFVMRRTALAALNVGSNAMGWARFAQVAKGMKPRTFIAWLLTMVVAAVMAGGLALVTPGIRARFTTAFADVSSLPSINRAAVWIALFVAVGLFILRRARRPMKEKPELRFEQVNESKTCVETIADSESAAARSTGQVGVQESQFAWIGSFPKLNGPFVVKRGNRRVLNWPVIGMNVLFGVGLICVVLQIMQKSMNLHGSRVHLIELLIFGLLAVLYILRGWRDSLSVSESQSIKLGGAPAMQSNNRQRKPFDCVTWSPFQSPEVQEICAHLTDAERSTLASRGALTGAWMFVVPFLALFAAIQSGKAGFIVLLLGAMAVFYATFVAITQHRNRAILCSTNWARNQGFTPDKLRLFSFSAKPVQASASTPDPSMGREEGAQTEGGGRAAGGEKPSDSLVTSAEERLSRRPWPLIVVAVLFILTGCVAAWDIGSNFRHHVYSANISLLGLSLGIGLLRLRPRWRVVALIMIWLPFVLGACLGIAAVFGQFTVLSHATFFGFELTGIPRFVATIAACTLIPLLLVWMSRVLTRSEVKALFQQGAPDRPWIEWAALPVTIMIASLLSSLTASSGSAQSRIANPLPEGSGSAAFGPAIERTLPLNALGYSYCLDLDSDLMSPMPANLTQADWSSGITLPDGIIVIALTADQPLKVAGTGTQVVPMVDRDRAWETLRPSELSFPDQAVSGEAVTVTGERRPPPLTFAFKTAKNTRGLLQITDWTDNSRGLKIRYKLVRDSKTDVAPTSSVAPAAEQP